MSETEDRTLRALFAQSAMPEDAEPFVSGVMDRIARQRRAMRMTNLLAIACCLLVAAVLSPWIGMLVQRGIDLLRILFSQPLVLTQMTFAIGGIALVLVAGFAAWASRN